MAEITKADELRLVQARKASPYIRTPQEDGVDYPIPELEGASRKILVDRDTMHSTMCTWGYSRFEPKTALHKKHAHPDCEEIMYILSGRGVGGMDETEALFCAGDTIFVPQNVVHWFYNPFDEPVEMLWLYTKPSLRESGYSMESGGYQNVGGEIEKEVLSR